MLALMTKSSKYQSFTPDTIIPLDSRSLWIIARGIVKGFSTDNNENIINLGYWDENDVIGLPLSTVKPYYIKSVTHVTLEEVYPQDSNEILPSIINHTKKMQQFAYILRTSLVKERLLLFLEWLAYRFGKPVDKGTLIDIPLTHEEIASFIGATRITVSKTMKKLQNDNLISYPRARYIVIKNIKHNFS